jgi:hypothetical protein
MKKRTAIALAFAMGIIALAFIPGTAAVKKVPPLSFRSPLKLAKWTGSEPSVAVDPQGSYVYVVAPPGWPVGANFDPTTMGTTIPKGIALWVSNNGGLSFTRNAQIGSMIGGGDTDVTVDRNGKVYVADLEVASSSVCSSPRGGASWTSLSLPQQDHCTEGLPFNHVGVVEDRPWIVTGPHNEVYFAYHDFATGMPVVMKSTDGGQKFTPCGLVFDPQGPAAKSYSPVNGTLVAKPVVGKDGTIYMTVSQGDPQSTSPITTISRHYMAVAPGGCTETTVWKNYKIYENPGGNFTLFNQLAIDGGGILYAVAAGRTKSTENRDSVWMFVSRNRGQTWSAPIRVNSTSLKGNVMPAVAGGLRANQVAVGWFGTPVSGSPNYKKNYWRYYAATSFNAGSTWSQATVSPSPAHYGDICTNGLLCNAIQVANFGCDAWSIFIEDPCVSPTAQESMNRNLADFSSIAVNPKTGCVIAVYPGDPHNRPDIGGNDDLQSYAYVSTQSGGACLK